ncbi:MAG: tetratricopeptide repeat protein [Pseudomonadota bacterium]
MTHYSPATLDVHGCPVHFQTSNARDAWDALNIAFLSHDARTGDHLAALLSCAPTFALGQACRGLFSLLLGRRELVETAQEALSYARRAAEDNGAVDTRTQTYIAALDAYLSDRLFKAADILDTYLADAPHDALAVKLCHAIRFLIGDASGMRKSIEAVLPAYGADQRITGYMHGCHAFTLEETGDQAAAERAGRRALELAPDDAWGLHAVAHVFDMTARARDGVRWIEDRTDAWRHCNNFRYHVWWHLALFYLDTGAYDEVLRLYDAEVRQDRTDDYRDISNAASLLSRLELEGVDVADRWEELAAISETRVNDGCVVFADLHYMLSLLGGDRSRATTRLLYRMRMDAGRNGDMARITEHPGLNAASGLMAFSDGNYVNAYANLRAARDAMPTIGGSHAQRDVFERITIEAAIRAGALPEARRLVDDRASRRGGVDGYTLTRRNTIEGLISETRDIAIKNREVA